MRTRKIFLFIVLGLLLCAAGSVVALRLTWEKPLGPSLGLPTQTPSLANLPAIATALPPDTGQGVVSAPVVTSTQQAGSPVLSAPTPLPIASRQPLCGGPATMTILAVGSDYRDSSYLYGLADSIHIVRIDFTLPDVMIIDFPRDVWVEIPGLSDHYNLTHGKLNQAYFFGNPGMGYYDGPGEGPGLLARTLDLNFGLLVDHYIAVNMQTFVKFIDAVGGVDIQLDVPVDLNWGNATPDPKLILSVGTHHLDGQTALTMAQNRIPTTFQRMKYQKIILGALREKLLSPGMLPKIPKLVAQFITSVQTDLSPGDINSLICIAQQTNKDNIKADSFPQDMFTASDIFDPYRKVYTFIYEVDFKALRAMVADFMNGKWPMP